MGKYVLLYSSIFSDCLRGEGIGACKMLTYQTSMVSKGSLGNNIGGRRYSLVHLYFRVGASGLP